MKIKQVMLTVVAHTMVTGVVLAQSPGLAPVYIPGHDIAISKAAKSSKVVRAGFYNKVTQSAGSSTRSNIAGLGEFGSSHSSSSGGCDCGSCRLGIIQPGSFANDSSHSGGCDCDCNCGGGDRVGQSFFGRLRSLSPIKVNVNRGIADSGNDDSLCPSCSRSGRPFSVRLNSNHCATYTAIFGGYVDLEDYDYPAGGGSNLADFNDGWQIGFKRGLIFQNGIRLESEFSFRHNTNDSVSVGSFVGQEFVPTGQADATNSLYQISNLTNILYDFQGFGRTTPYIGVGAGGVYADGDIQAPGVPVDASIADYTFAYQLIAGVSRRISPRLTGFAEYKYFGTSGVEVGDSLTGADLVDFDLQSNNVIFGLRWNRARRR